MIVSSPGPGGKPVKRRQPIFGAGVWRFVQPGRTSSQLRANGEHSWPLFFLLPLLALLAWWVATSAGFVERFFLPPPEATLATARQLLASWDFWHDMLLS